MMRNGEYNGYRRGLSKGHVFRGANRELGRVSCFLLIREPEDKGYRMDKSPGVRSNSVLLVDKLELKWF